MVERLRYTYPNRTECLGAGARPGGGVVLGGYGDGGFIAITTIARQPCPPAAQATESQIETQ